MKTSRVAVIGAGPAGLAAASALSNLNGGVVVFDKGKSLVERRHDASEDLGIGLGGAGLFSDGKFSFYPSGTHVYRLKSDSLLQESFSWMSEVLEGVGIKTETFPDLGRGQPTSPASCGFNKTYPSHYGTLAQRFRLVERMMSRSAHYETGASVERVRRVEGGYEVVYRNAEHRLDALRVSGLIVATGRLGNLDLLDEDGIIALPSRRLRFELGMRIESPSRIGFLSREKTPDVKCIWKKGAAEIRTFCTCRRGEVWNIPYGDIAALSGRSDGPPTEFSNFGFLARFSGEHFERGKAHLERVMRSELIRSGEAMWEPLGSFLGRAALGSRASIDPARRPWYPRNKFRRGKIADILGPELYQVFVGALEELLSFSPDLLHEETACLFPAIEGTGLYPTLDDNLKVYGENIWCAGDLAGSFRGITPAMLSGYYTGLQVRAALSYARPARYSTLPPPPRRSSIPPPPQHVY